MKGNSLSVLRPKLLADHEAIVAGFTTRLGGVSDAPYAALNVGLSTDDDERSVARNREILFADVGLDPDRVAFAGQVHGARVLVVDSGGIYVGFDGLVTTERGLTLGITAADCAVVLMADTDAGVVGACHAGWRGTVDSIGSVTVGEMVKCGAEPDRIVAYVSPCISVEHFEVGEEVAARFASKFVERRKEWRRPHVDLSGAIREQLVAAGVGRGSIEVSGMCTFADPATFFSHRASGGVTGRMLGFIALR